MVDITNIKKLYKIQLKLERIIIVGKCELCDQQKELKESHIIPKFIGKWIKDTSATGYLRNPNTPNWRKQDLFKIKLLCGDCEQTFNDFETQFANKIFYPFQNGKETFKYEEWLAKFIISINWRIAVYQFKKDKVNLSNELEKQAKKALKIWKEYLLGRNNKRGNYAHHIFFLDRVQDINWDDEIPNNLNMYFLRAVDGTIANSNSIIFVFSKLPGIIMVSHIYPQNINGWKNTRIYDNGFISVPQECSVPGFGEFLKNRLFVINEKFNKMSDIQKEKINKTVKNNKERFKKSQSLLIKMADIMLKRKE